MLEDGILKVQKIIDLNNKDRYGSVPFCSGHVCIRKLVLLCACRNQTARILEYFCPPVPSCLHPRGRRCSVLTHTSAWHASSPSCVSPGNEENKGERGLNLIHGEILCEIFICIFYFTFRVKKCCDWFFSSHFFIFFIHVSLNAWHFQSDIKCVS